VAGDSAELTGATDAAGSSTTTIEQASGVGRWWRGSGHARRARERASGFGRVREWERGGGRAGRGSKVARGRGRGRRTRGHGRVHGGEIVGGRLRTS
jgi:hypothetical protein